ncbi:MAG: hypothetical protein CL902_00390 [Dehalococcoidia bacterium]|nr:hypothetical protein [Dehalococcoidia bacterium]|tara:strand:+ start:421 stop:1056 length:636 start_codon:yes stop_codon:yes gene_type:complete
MSATLFDTCPASVTYAPTVNIFTGTLFPELLDGPAVDVDRVAFDRDTFGEVLDELVESHENPREASERLFSRMFEVLPPTSASGNNFGRTRRRLPVTLFTETTGAYSARMWVSPWGYTVAARVTRTPLSGWEWWEPQANRHGSHPGRHDRPPAGLAAILEAVQGNQVPAGKKRPAMTTADLRRMLDRRGVTVNLPKRATRAQVLATWKAWA